MTLTSEDSVDDGATQAVVRAPRNYVLPIHIELSLVGCILKPLPFALMTIYES